MVCLISFFMTTSCITSYWVIPHNRSALFFAARLTTVPRCFLTSSGNLCTASLMLMNNTPALPSSSLKVVATETESNTRSRATCEDQKVVMRGTPEAIMLHHSVHWTKVSASCKKQITAKSGEHNIAARKPQELSQIAGCLATCKMHVALLSSSTSHAHTESCQNRTATPAICSKDVR